MNELLELLKQSSTINHSIVAGAVLLIGLLLFVLIIIEASNASDDRRIGKRLALLETARARRLDLLLIKLRALGNKGENQEALTMRQQITQLDQDIASISDELGVLNWVVGKSKYRPEYD